MKRFSAMLLALCLLIALCACGNEPLPPPAAEIPSLTPAPKPVPTPAPTPTPPSVDGTFVGSWAAPLDCIRLLQLLSPDNADMFGAGPAYAELLLELCADGSYDASVNFSPAIPALRDGLFRYIEAESGKSIEDVAAEHDMRADDLLDLYLNEAALQELLGDGARRSGSFRTEGDAVLLDEAGEYTLRLSGDALHMQDSAFGELVFARK